MVVVPTEVMIVADSTDPVVVMAWALEGDMIVGIDELGAVPMPEGKIFARRPVPAGKPWREPTVPTDGKELGPPTSGNADEFEIGYGTKPVEVGCKQPPTQLVIVIVDVVRVV